MAQFTSLENLPIYVRPALPVNDIDTDQIIPARFLKVDRQERSGRCAVRRLALSTMINRPSQGFHAQQARMQRAAKFYWRATTSAAVRAANMLPGRSPGYGFRAVISTSFADIFRNNSLKNGLIPIIVDDATHKMLFDLVEEAPRAELTVDLATQTLSFPGGSVTFPIDPFNKTCLLNGVDELGYILGFEKEIAAFEAQRW
jgi:3-isopropylmalate/(R)-2-methylmalate dehydratase small subunit